MATNTRNNTTQGNINTEGRVAENHVGAFFNNTLAGGLGSFYWAPQSYYGASNGFDGSQLLQLHAVTHPQQEQGHNKEYEEEEEEESLQSSQNLQPPRGEEPSSCPYQFPFSQQQIMSQLPQLPQVSPSQIRSNFSYCYILPNFTS